LKEKTWRACLCTTYITGYNKNNTTNIFSSSFLESFNIFILCLVSPHERI
jgi:hypothetical protein